MVEEIRIMSIYMSELIIGSMIICSIVVVGLAINHVIKIIERDNHDK